MRIPIIITLILLSASIHAQRDYIRGTVYDTAGVALSDVYVRNLDAGSITSTNEGGEFRILAANGDSIKISFIGYESRSVKVDENWIQSDPPFFILKPVTTYLDEVTISKFPEYQQFKEDILSADINDTSFQLYGVSKVVISEEDRLNASLKSRGPISLLHNKFSKRAKEQKKFRSVIQNQGNAEKANKKFTRSWVSESTQLQGDKLTSFIAYCDFSEAYLSATPVYIIHEDMMVLLPQFLEEYEEKG